jgi:hypothetical protein
MAVRAAFWAGVGSKEKRLELKRGLLRWIWYYTYKKEAKNGTFECKRD